jgi:hypothetical protein
MDLWAHCMAATDAAARLDPGNPRLRLAALVHDIGKPGTLADGHFIGHDTEGARLAELMLTRLAFPRREVEAVSDLVRYHMFSYEPRWSSAAVRRFIKRIGRDQVSDLLNLRAADNIGSGLPANGGRARNRRAVDVERARATRRRPNGSAEPQARPRRGPTARLPAPMGARRTGTQFAQRTDRRSPCPIGEIERRMIEALLQAERLLIHGMVDQAEQIYARAIEQDPHNAIAVVGLARVALERGQERLAHERAREALQIDPENVAAQRLEQRLAEVFAERERPAQPPLPAAAAPRASEQAVFNRNPSMADHTAAQERRAAQVPHASPVESRGQHEAAPNSERRSGLWRRILGE